MLHQPSAFDEGKTPPSVLGMGWVLQAFEYLSKRRRTSVAATMGGGTVEIGRIQVSEIAGYCDLFQILDPERREDLAYYLDGMDDVFIEMRTPGKKGRKAAIGGPADPKTRKQVGKQTNA